MEIEDHTGKSTVRAAWLAVDAAFWIFHIRLIYSKASLERAAEIRWRLRDSRRCIKTVCTARVHGYLGALVWKLKLKKSIGKPAWMANSPQRSHNKYKWINTCAIAWPCTALCHILSQLETSQQKAGQKSINTPDACGMMLHKCRVAVSLNIC